MGLRLAERFLWDFWTVEHAGLTWLYALSAPRDHDPETRHWRARVDLAVSRDLATWNWRGPVLEPGPPGAWDDMAIWTGSAARHPDGGFAMLYTGLSRAEAGRVQRVGVARSHDLLRWAKHPMPVIEADPAYYRQRGRDAARAWRDPWLEWDAAARLWRAYITAQHREGPVETSGTVALATSPDLIRWSVHPPLVEQRLTEHLEVPQVLDGGARLLANTYVHHVPLASPLPRRCMSLLYRRDGAGYCFARVVEAHPTDARYTIKRVRDGVGLCWLGRQADGVFLGEIGDPFALRLD